MEGRLCQAAVAFGAKEGKWGHGNGELPGDPVAAATASRREVRGSFPIGAASFQKRSSHISLSALPDPAGCELQEARASCVCSSAQPNAHLVSGPWEVLDQHLLNKLAGRGCVFSFTSSFDRSTPEGAWKPLPLKRGRLDLGVWREVREEI